jgi:hypothetical protein
LISLEGFRNLPGLQKEKDAKVFSYFP